MKLTIAGKLFAVLWLLVLASAFAYTFFNFSWWAPTSYQCGERMCSDGRDFLILLFHVFGIVFGPIGLIAFTEFD